MSRIAGPALKALGCEIRLAALSLKLDVLVSLLEQRYRPDQPRAPKGTREGGRWIDDLSRLMPAQQSPDRVQVAGPKCDGFSSGCQMGGTFGTTGMFKMMGRNMCFDCAVKYFSLEDMTRPEQIKYLMQLDPEYKRGGR